MGELLENTLALYLEAAPWLLLGLLAAGLIKAWIPEQTMTRWLGGEGLWPITKAALVGAPLPLCSCGVLPAALGLHRSGASKSSTIAFLIATPETGADSIAISYALLGPFMTVLRPLAAIISAITTGLITALVPETRAAQPLFSINVATPVSSCGSGCCGCETAQTPVVDSRLQKTLNGIRFALTDILDDIAGWLALGIVLAGLITTLIPPDSLASWGSGILAMILMLLIGIPMYICATASTPLAAAMLIAGISPGTVLVFLLAGPATNLATLAVVRKELGSKILFAYLAGISLASICLGLLTDYLVTSFTIDIQAQLGDGGELLPQGLVWASAVILILAAIKPLRRRILR